MTSVSHEPPTSPVPNTAATPADDLLVAAVRALTAAARRRGGPDFAAFVSLALAGAAANVGGVEAVLADRPGSWEADGVRQLLRSTVGDDNEYLWEHATEPLIVHLWLDPILNDLGAWAAYDAAEEELQRRAQAAGGPTFVTGEPPCRPWTEEEDDARTAAQDVIDSLDEQRCADWTAYGEALAAAVKAAANARGIPMQVDVQVHEAGFPEADDQQQWNPLISELCVAATTTVPLPGRGVGLLDRLQDASPERRQRSATECA